MWRVWQIRQIGRIERIGRTGRVVVPPDKRQQAGLRCGKLGLSIPSKEDLTHLSPKGA